MAKLDLDLIIKPGHGQPVPKEFDRHMVKYIIGQRKEAIERDSSLLDTERWDHSDVFYAIRTYLNRLGWDTSVYNDNVRGGNDRRKGLYDMIRETCEDYYDVKRHQIGIFPEDRAVMAFNGKVYAVSFDNLRTLMLNGTDVIVVEKQGTVIKMVPFTENIGIAFIQSQGFVSEYGIALACLCDGQYREAISYTSSILPTYHGHLGVLTDCDSSGLLIGLKVKYATRIGVDLDTILEMNLVNSGLGLKLEDLQESTKVNSHWISLNNMLSSKGKLRKGLSSEDLDFYSNYLTSYSPLTGGNIQFIDYLKNNRIELNTILAAAKPQALWNWLKWKISRIWPYRNYNRAINVHDTLQTPTLRRFSEWYQELSRPILEDSVEYTRSELSKVEGFYEDVQGREEEIKNDMLNDVLLKNEKVKKIDLALESLMRQHGGTKIPEDNPDDKHRGYEGHYSN